MRKGVKKKMPKKLKLNGTVVSDGVAWIYDYFGISNISPGKVSGFLDEANGDDVEITINSGGGDVYSGADIYTTLKGYPGNSTVNIIFAASAASAFAMGGKKVLMSPAGQMMIHNSSTAAWGDRNEMSGTANMLKSVDESIANAYVNKTGMSREELLSLMDKETWMDAVKAKELGFVDEIMFAEEVPQMSNSAAGGHLLPQEVIDKMRNEIEAGFKKGNENKQPIPPSNSTLPPVTELSAPQTIVNKEETKTMDMKELKEKHPALFAEITNTAQTAERSRIASLQDLATAPGAAPFIADAIANGDTAGDVAMKIVQASISRVNQEGTQRQKDSDDSGVKNVSPEAPVITVSASNDDAENEQAVNNMIEYAKQLQNKKGGRK
jgi:ATP-dependent protease ClpP protease subunit